ncbi:MAG TPA: DUF309 domain-containing protein [Thermoanaerobaculia bacterium]|jgi:hypothetical protein
MNPSTARLLELGRVAFNEGRYFEAHELWEEAWLAEKGETRRLLQGLIQIAAGYYKAFGQKQPNGCARLLEAGLSKLNGAMSPLLALAPFVKAVRDGLKEARRWERGVVEGLDAAAAPRLHRRVKLA